MYELYQVSENEWQVHSEVKNAKAYSGSFASIAIYCIHVLGIKPNELEYAVSDMCDKENDAIQFGLHKSFIYSFKREHKYGRLI